MSVLSFPRIYFNGYMQWNVDTTNNNDYVPVYDAADARGQAADPGSLGRPDQRRLPATGPAADRGAV
jgi:hypothetical protein